MSSRSSVHDTHLPTAFQTIIKTQALPNLKRKSNKIVYCVEVYDTNSINETTTSLEPIKVRSLIFSSLLKVHDNQVFQKL
jgi:hypothetical protein